MKVDKPWGKFIDLHRDEEARFVLKELVVEPWQRLSLQAHEGRTEIWYVLSGEGRNEGDRPVPLRKGSLITVMPGEVHRLVAGIAQLRVLELQVGQCTEDDIRRLEDDYER